MKVRNRFVPSKYEMDRLQIFEIPNYTEVEVGSGNKGSRVGCLGNKIFGATSTASVSLNYQFPSE